MKKLTSKKSEEKVFLTKSGHRLSARQEAFCQLYASDQEVFGNGTQAYIRAYGLDPDNPKDRANARTSAYENLTKPYILERINEIFEGRGLNDAFVDKQLEKLITQDADFSTKMKAIAEYNKLKARITEKKDITSGGEKIVPTALVEFVDGKGKD